jgi:hypothetical protein
MNVRRRCLLLAISLASVALHAQSRGDHIPGFLGLQSGTQAPPGLYVGNLVYVYPTSTIKTDSGREVPLVGSLTSTADAILVTLVTPQKVLGGHFGVSAAVPFVKNRIQTNSLDVNNGFGFTDMFVNANLGWQLKRADITAGYNAYFPSGRFVAGARDNRGLGMWGNEATIGSTLYFDQKKLWHAAANFGAEFHTEKENTGITVGDLGTVEGGFGRTFYKKGAGPIPTVMNVGVAGYAQFKITSDNGPGVPVLLRGLKDRVFGLGPEFNIFMPGPRLTFLIRYEPEFGARNRTQGHTVVISLVWVAKSLVRPHATAH